MQPADRACQQWRSSQGARQPSGFGVSKNLPLVEEDEAGPARRLPRSGSPQMKEAHASPAGRGFGPMPPGPGRIPCRIAGTMGNSVGGRNASTAFLAPARLMRAGLRPSGSSASSHPRVLAASPANRIMPSSFRPDGERLHHHPTSTAPTTRHDLASVQRTRGESHGLKAGG